MRDDEIPISLNYINLLMTANKRAEQTFNTLVLGKIQWEFAKDMGYESVPNLDYNGPPAPERKEGECDFEYLLRTSSFKLKIKTVDFEDFIGFANE